MQTANTNVPITVTGRHVSITEAIRDHAHKKVASLHLDYPRIIEARVILDVECNHRHLAEIVLYCANHITIEASSVTSDMYGSIDETISKVARRMRKYKTRMLKRSHRPKKSNGSVKLLAERVYVPTENDALENQEISAADPQPLIVHREQQKLKTLSEQEAITEMELGDRPFLAFLDSGSNEFSILYRREDGDYAAVQPDSEAPQAAAG